MQVHTFEQDGPDACVLEGDGEYEELTMLAADRRLLQATVEQKRLEIKNIEIGHYTSNLDMITQQGALVGGFSLGALAGVDNASSPWHFIYTQSLTASVCLNIASVIICTFCSISGPKMALLGPEGSPFVACKKLKASHELASKLNIGGMATFFIALLDMGFYLFKREASTSMMVQLVAATLFTMWTVMRIRKDFAFAPNTDLDHDYRENAPEWTTEGKAREAFNGASTLGDKNPLHEQPKVKSRDLIKAGMLSIKEGKLSKWKVKYVEVYRDFLAEYECQNGDVIGTFKLHPADDAKHDAKGYGAPGSEDAYVHTHLPKFLGSSDSSFFKSATFGLQVQIGTDILRFDFATEQDQSDWSSAILYCADEAEQAAELRREKKKGKGKRASFMGSLPTMHHDNHKPDQL